MFARHVIAAAAVAGLMMTGAVATSAFAQTNGNAAQTAPAKPMHKGAMHKGAMHHEAAKAKRMASKEGHKLDNIADQLNACMMKPAAERQGCINDATRM